MNRIFHCEKSTSLFQCQCFCFFVERLKFRPECGGFSLLSTWMTWLLMTPSLPLTTTQMRNSAHFAFWHVRTLTSTIYRPVNDPAVRQTTSQPVCGPTPITFPQIRGYLAEFSQVTWPSSSRVTAWVTQPLNDYANEKVNGSWGRQLFELAGKWPAHSSHLFTFK